MSIDSLKSNRISSFVISIFIKELNTTHNIRVDPTATISKVATDLINKIHLKYDWSEFWFWNPTEKLWLLPKSNIVSQFKLQPYSKINFVRRFNVLNIQLPDLQIRQLLLDFSKTVFQTNQIICKQFGIRHHEELSLQWKELKKLDSNTPVPNRRRISQSVSQQNVRQSSNRNRDSTLTSGLNTTGHRKRFTKPIYLTRNSQNDLEEPSPFNLVSPVSFFSIFDDLSLNETDLSYYESFENSKLTNSPKKSFSEALKQQDIVIYKTYKDRANSPFHWMISELTLMEQAVGDYNNVLLRLRYKYHNYYWFNEKYDEIRINQIFHQSYWSVISGETDCSADETYLLAGILHHINKLSTNDTNSETANLSPNDLDKEIDSMLDRLHFDLIGKSCNEDEMEHIEIAGNIELIKYPRNILSLYKKHSAVLSNEGINIIKTTNVSSKIPIKGNEIRLNVKIRDKKIFIIEIILLKNNQNNKNELNNKTSKSFERVKIRFYNQQEFIKWATALRLLSKSIDFTLLSNFKYEYQMVTNIVEMKSPQFNLKMLKTNKEVDSVNLVDIIGSIHNKPFKSKEILQKVLYFAKSFSHLSKIEAKIAYIKCWLTLNNSGFHYMTVHVNQNSELQIIGIGYDRLILADIETGMVTNLVEMNKLISWKTNWELNNTLLMFSETFWKINFKNSWECQIFHEYLGGYLFILMRNSEKFSDLNETIFRSLTGRNAD